MLEAACGTGYWAQHLARSAALEIVKNWYDGTALEALFRERGRDFWCRELEQFWGCGYTTV